MKTQSLKSILFKILMAVLVISFISSPIVTNYGASPVIAFMAVAALFMIADKGFSFLHTSITGLTLYAPTDSLNLATLASELTDYFQVHYQMIFSEVLIQLFGEDGYGLGRQMTFLPGIVDELVLDSVSVTPFIHQWNPSSSTTFNPTAGAITPAARKLKVQPYEGDLQFLDKEIKKSHLMWQKRMQAIALMDGPTQTQTFIEYLFWDVIIKRCSRDLRRAAMQAIYNPSTTYGLMNICDGFEQVITAEIAATNLIPISMGTITKANVVEGVESVFDTLDTAVQKADDLIICLRSDVYKAWGRADRYGLGRTWQYDSAKNMTIDMYGNSTIIEEPDFVLNKCVIYRKGNAFIGIDEMAAGNWEIQRIDRSTKFMLNGEMGLQFSMVNPGGEVNMAVGQ